MKVKELIEILDKLDPEKEVMIQQGGQHEYMAVYGAANTAVWEGDELNDIKYVIGIHFT